MRSSYRKNPQRHAEYSAERMAAQFDPAALLYCEILERDPCSYHVGPGGTIDHVVAIKTGGDSSWDNLTSACHACNAAKGKKSLLAFMLYRLEVQAS
jgi:5-methylcytosine-specific restriction endonuclease McrA